MNKRFDQTLCKREYPSGCRSCEKVLDFTSQRQVQSDRYYNSPPTLLELCDPTVPSVGENVKRQSWLESDSHGCFVRRFTESAKASRTHAEGWQDTPPQNMPSRHENYFNLKAVEEQQVQEDVKDALLIPGGKEHSYHQRQGAKAERILHRETLLT